MMNENDMIQNLKLKFELSSQHFCFLLFFLIMSNLIQRKMNFKKIVKNGSDGAIYLFQMQNLKKNLLISIFFLILAELNVMAP